MAGKYLHGRAGLRGRGQSGPGIERLEARTLLYAIIHEASDIGIGPVIGPPAIDAAAGDGEVSAAGEPTKPITRSTGNFHCLFIRLAFSDAPTVTPQTAAQINTEIAAFDQRSEERRV